MNDMNDWNQEIEFPRTKLQAEKKRSLQFDKLLENRKNRPIDMDSVCERCQAIIQPRFLPFPPIGRWEPGECQSEVCKAQRAALYLPRNLRHVRMPLVVSHDPDERRFQVADYTFGGWLSYLQRDERFIRDFMGKNARSSDPRLNMSAQRQLLRFINDGQKSHGFLALEGPPDAGKTFLEAVACNIMIDTYLDNQTHMTRPVFATLSAFWNAYKEAKTRPDTNNHMVLIQRAKDASLLALDDIAQVPMRVYDFEPGKKSKLESPPELRELLFMILDERMIRKLPTILSINNQEDIEAILGKGAAARLLYGTTIHLVATGRRHQQYEKDRKEQHGNG